MELVDSQGVQIPGEIEEIDDNTHIFLPEREFIAGDLYKASLIEEGQVIQEVGFVTQDFSEREIEEPLIFIREKRVELPKPGEIVSSCGRRSVFVNASLYTRKAPFGFLTKSNNENSTQEFIIPGETFDREIGEEWMLDSSVDIAFSTLSFSGERSPTARESIYVTPSEEQSPSLGGCGMTHQNPPPSNGSGPLMLILPLLLLIGLRQSAPLLSTSKSH